MDSTPASLLDRVRHRDDATAWSRFVDLYTPLIYGWARRIGLQESDACDLVQNVFALLLRKMADFSYDPHRSFRAWLKTVALNLVREGQRRGAEGPLPDGDGRSLADSDASSAFWEDEYRRDVFRRAIAIMQRDFHPTTWKACWEAVVEGRPAAQVAAQLGITVGAVYAARCRVLARLRQELAGLLD